MNRFNRHRHLQLAADRLGVRLRIPLNRGVIPNGDVPGRRWAEEPVGNDVIPEQARREDLLGKLRTELFKLLFINAFIVISTAFLSIEWSVSNIRTADAEIFSPFVLPSMSFFHRILSTVINLLGFLPIICAEPNYHPFLLLSIIWNFCLFIATLIHVFVLVVAVTSWNVTTTSATPLLAFGAMIAYFYAKSIVTTLTIYEYLREF